MKTQQFFNEKSLQFNPIDGIADQFKNCLRIALLLIYFKFYLDLEPILKFSGRLYTICILH
jgi:hypothetical protein